MSDAPKKKSGPQKGAPPTPGDIRRKKQQREKARARKKLERERKILVKRNLWRLKRQWKPDHRPTEQVITEACPTRVRAQYHIYVYDKGSYKALRGQYIQFVCASYREFERLTTEIAKLVKSTRWTDARNPEHEVEAAAHAPQDPPAVP